MQELDDLIDLFNNKKVKVQLPSINNTKPSSAKSLLSSNNISSSHKFKYLTFKPWSGIVKNDFQSANNTDTIKQEIQAEQQKSTNDVEEFADLSNAAKDNQIGYFYKFQTGHVKLIKYLFDENGFKYANSNKNWTIYWSNTVIKPQVYQELMPYQKVNHFPNSFHLTRKDLMNKNISKMQAKYGATHFNFLPKTYILPQQLEMMVQQAQKYNYTYIVKPHNCSQGKGITVTSSPAVIQAKLQKYSSLVVSHYIDNPLLINRLKFDLRIYVAITGINPLRIYVYEEGLARFATQIYDHSGQDTQNKKYQHLTNYSINKKNTEFSKPNENQQYFGSKWSLTSLKDFLVFNIGKTQTQNLFESINDLMVKTIICGENILFTSFNKSIPYINSCFQVLGFDILIDSNLKPWLIEINMSPSMNTDSPLDLKIKGNLISDLLTMVGVTPLDQRYLDGGHTKFQTKNFQKSQMKKLQTNSLADKFILKMVQQQNQRRGKWNRVFPVRNNRYKNYFQVDRYYNRLLRQGMCQPIYKAPFIIGGGQHIPPNHRHVQPLSNKKINFNTKVRKGYSSVKPKGSIRIRNNYHSTTKKF